MINMHSFMLCLTSKLKSCSSDSKTLRPSSVARLTSLGLDGLAYKNHSRLRSSRLHMCRKLDGNDVKLLPWRNRYLRLYLPRLPKEAGRDLIQFSETLSVCNYVRLSPKQYGIS